MLNLRPAGNSGVGVHALGARLHVFSHSLSCACHSGVNNTAVHVTAVQFILMCTSQQCHWNRCATNFVKYFRKLSETLFFMRESDSTAHGTAASLIPLWHAQQYHWHCCDMHSSIFDNALTCIVVSMTPLWLCVNHRGANDTAVTCIAVSITPLWLAKQYQQHRCDLHSRVSRYWNYNGNIAKISA
jgi:hypothetical protein